MYTNTTPKDGLNPASSAKAERDKAAVTLLTDMEDSWAKNALLYCNPKPKTFPGSPLDKYSFRATSLVFRHKMMANNLLVMNNITHGLDQALAEAKHKFYYIKGDLTHKMYREDDPTYLQTKNTTEYTVIGPNEVNHLRTLIKQSAANDGPAIIDKLYKTLYGTRSSFPYINTRIKLYKYQPDVVNYFVSKAQEILGKLAAENKLYDLHQSMAERNWLTYTEGTKTRKEKIAPYAASLFKIAVAVVYRLASGKTIANDARGGMQMVQQHLAAYGTSIEQVKNMEKISLMEAFVSSYKQYFNTDNGKLRVGAEQHVWGVLNGIADLVMAAGVEADADLILLDQIRNGQNPTYDVPMMGNEITKAIGHSIVNGFFMDSALRMLSNEKRATHSSARKEIDDTFQGILMNFEEDKLRKMVSPVVGESALILTDEFWNRLPEGPKKAIFAGHHVQAGLPVTRSMNAKNKMVESVTAGILIKINMIFKSVSRGSKEEPYNQDIIRPSTMMIYLADIYYESLLDDINRQVESKKQNVKDIKDDKVVVNAPPAQVPQYLMAGSPVRSAASPVRRVQVGGRLGAVVDQGGLHSADYQTENTPIADVSALSVEAVNVRSGSTPRQVARHTPRTNQASPTRASSPPPQSSPRAPMQQGSPTRGPPGAYGEDM